VIFDFSSFFSNFDSVFLVLDGQPPSAHILHVPFSASFFAWAGRFWAFCPVVFLVLARCAQFQPRHS
jgi:hypothetical protein